MAVMPMRGVLQQHLRHPDMVFPRYRQAGQMQNDGKLAGDVPKRPLNRLEKLTFSTAQAARIEFAEPVRRRNPAFALSGNRYDLRSLTKAPPPFSGPLRAIFRRHASWCMKRRNG